MEWRNHISLEFHTSDSWNSEHCFFQGTKTDLIGPPLWLLSLHCSIFPLILSCTSLLFSILSHSFCLWKRPFEGSLFLYTFCLDFHTPLSGYFQPIFLLSPSTTPQTATSNLSIPWFICFISFFCFFLPLHSLNLPHIAFRLFSHSLCRRKKGLQRATIPLLYFS